MAEKRIKDLMLSLEAFSHISPQEKVGHAVKVLETRKQQGLPAFLLVVEVIDQKEEILGMLSPETLLSHMESSREPTEELPIFWQGQFQEECEAVFGNAIADVMSPVTRVIHGTGTLTEAVHLMHLQGTDWLPVVAEQSVVGIILKDALIEEVFQAAKAVAA
jgi:CBS-domain-containing membrane protein